MNDKRLSWDAYFMQIASIVGDRSSCLSRKIGVVMVRDNSILSTGYNGPPRGIPHCEERLTTDEKFKQKLKDILIDHTLPELESMGIVGGKLTRCPRRILGFKSGEGLEWCVAAHAERNALINAARMGISTKGATLYMTCGIPCTPCLVEIINAGISRLVVTSLTQYDLMADYLLKGSGIEVVEFCKTTDPA